jgi:arylsulfatase A-like enzyme
VRINSFSRFLLLTPIIYFVLFGFGLKKTKGKVDYHISEFKPRNVILITISSLRADHTSALGYRRQTTPNFDRFVKSSVLFTNAFATSSWAMPSGGTIFTSLYPSNHGAAHIDKVLASKCDTLAETLKRFGYYTAGFCCNPRLSGEAGFAQGFDLYDDYSVNMMLASISFEDEVDKDINKQRTNDLINDAVIRWLRNNKHKPFFLYVHYYDNHWDYLPPSPYDHLYAPDYKGTVSGREIAREPLYSNKPSDRDVEHIIALYDGQLRQTDQDLGQLLDFLKKYEFLKDTIFIVMGDHGEQFYEHGHTSHHGIYDELVHIPLAIYLPNEEEEGKIVDSLVSCVDIMPTILDLLDLPIPDTCRGISLKPLLEGKQRAIRDYVLIEYTGGAVPSQFGVRSEHYKYIETENDVFAFDLNKDPLEEEKIPEMEFNEQMTILKKYMPKLFQVGTANE